MRRGRRQERSQEPGMSVCFQDGVRDVAQEGISTGPKTLMRWEMWRQEGPRRILGNRRRRVSATSAVSQEDSLSRHG